MSSLISISRRFNFVLAVVFFGSLSPDVVRADLWCTGYYPGWEQSSMPPSAIDFTVITHVVHFSVVPISDGTIDSNANSVTPANSSNLVALAHAAGRKASICVGGANSQAGFQGATASGNRAAFVSRLVSFMTARQYDGIDLDWESLDPSDANQYTNLVNDLRAALNPISPRPLLTMAVASPPTPVALIAQIQSQFDQINLMTYDLSGPYAGWITWFNAPIYDGGTRFASTGALVPSADGMIKSLTNGGVLPAKLGIGAAFYAWLWSGGNGTSTGGAALPRQSWSSAPSTSQASYNTIMSSYYSSNLYRWDNNAQAAYLTIDLPGSASDQFISYDDARTCQAKVSYARNNKLGGIMIWELAQDHLAGQPDPLLQAIKRALTSPGLMSLTKTNLNLDLSFTNMPLGSYRIQWASNLAPANWNTLATTNAAGPEGLLHIGDTNNNSVTSKFYRVQTPP